MQIDTYKLHHIHFFALRKKKRKEKELYDNSNIDALVSLSCI